MRCLQRLSSFPVAAVATCAALLASGCGGGGSSTSAAVVTPPPPAATNVVTVVVDDGPVDPAAGTGQPIGTVDTPFVSVTICAHGTATCQTIDHISVDTGSTGLRVISSVLSSPVAAALTQVTDAQGRPLAECLPFADGYSWGSVKMADAKLGGEEASGLSIEVIGDPAYPSVPSGCSAFGHSAENTVTTFGANGILGIGNFKQDCGTQCVSDSSPGFYYTCPSGSACVQTTVALANQVWNPVSLFATDNNGSILVLPSVGSAGAGSVSGTLVFGIDTQSNNALGTATVLTVDATSGNLTVTYKNRSLADSFIDSGSNGYFFTDSSIAPCTASTESGFYCPTATQNLSATVTSATGVMSTVSFSIASADSLFNGNNQSFFVFDDLGGINSLSDSFDLGLPFFLGRRVFTAIEGMSTSAGPGPFVAF